MKKLYIDLVDQIVEVKVNKQIIKVKTYIGIAEEVAFTKVCLDYYNKSGNYNIGVVKRIFDVCVIAKLTSIKIEGVKIKENEKKEIEIEIDMTQERWDALSSVGVTANLLAFVVNYDLVWHNIEMAIKLQNIRNSFIEFAKMMPNFKDMSKVLEKSIENVAKFRETDKKKFDMVVDNITNQKAIEKAKKEEKQKGNAKTKKVKG